MDIASKLDNKLRNQTFQDSLISPEKLTKFQQIAHGYSLIEQAIAVLSDLKSDKSYIYCGGVGQDLGLKNSPTAIESIWEKSIFERIHPDDLTRKHSLELYFFHWIKTIPIEQRQDYYISSNMRIQDASNSYRLIHHRMFYSCNPSSGSVELALCLYNALPSNKEPSEELIINLKTGQTEIPHLEQSSQLLTPREKEILSLIDKGYSSKEIASKLSISTNTVNRHRQNILEKLRVKNSHEASRVAKIMRMI